MLFSFPSFPTFSFPRALAVWIGPLIVKELKRIVEASEITKFVSHWTPSGVCD